MNRKPSPVEQGLARESERRRWPNSSRRDCCRFASGHWGVSIRRRSAPAVQSVSGNSFGTQESSRAFGDGAAYSSVFRVKFQRDGLVVVKSASGMDADAFVILFTVGNESGKSASGFLRPDFFPAINCCAHARSSRPSFPRNTMAHSQGCKVSACG